MYVDGKSVECEFKGYGDLPKPEEITRLAKELNENYDLYQGWSDTHILLDALREVGCDNCPFKADCEAVNEIVEDED